MGSHCGQLYVFDPALARLPIGRGALVVVDAGTYTERRRLAIPTFPSNLSLDAQGATLFMSASEPGCPEHPDHRPGALGSALRLDLDALAELP